MINSSNLGVGGSIQCLIKKKIKDHSSPIILKPVLHLCISQFQAPTSPTPGLTPGNFFKVVKFPAPRQRIFTKVRPRGKK